MLESITAKNLSHDLILSRLSKIADSDSVYWQSGDVKIWSRPMALRRLRDVHASKFVLHDDTWHHHDWSRPKKDLYQQYIDHARAIRSKYDYVRVAYSGGVDSHTILTAFRDAGEDPDEIFFWTFLDENHDSPTNYEAHRSIIPHLDTIKNWFPKVRIRWLNFDIEQLFALRSLPVEHHPFCHYSAGIRTLPVSMALCCFAELDQSNSITLTGSDKPRIDKIGGSWYSCIIDNALDQAWGRGVQGFYLAPDPTIHITQSHAIRRLLEHSHVDTRSKIYQFQNSSDRTTRNMINIAIERSKPFDDCVIYSKRSKRQYRDASEHQPKMYLLNRQLRTTAPGRLLLQAWAKTKKDFLDYTGFDHTTSIFGTFYNLDDGQAYTVDQLFPNGWHLQD